MSCHCENCCCLLCSKTSVHGEKCSIWWIIEIKKYFPLTRRSRVPPGRGGWDCFAGLQVRINSSLAGQEDWLLGRIGVFFKCCHSLFIFTLTEYAYNILYMILVECHSWSPHCFRSVEGLTWGDEPRFELGPAVQPADALLSKPRRTLRIGVLLTR